MIYNSISDLLQILVIFYLIYQVNRNRKLINRLAKTVIQLADKTLK